MSLQRVIRHLREQANLTQGQLEIKSGVSRSTIAMIEQGTRENPTISTILQLAAAFRTTPDAVLRLAGYLPSVPESVPGEQEAAAIFRSLSPVRRECALIMLRALLAASQSSPAIMVPETKSQLLDLINDSWYNLTTEQQGRIRDLVMDAVQQQIEEENQGEGEGEQEKRKCI